MFLSWFVSSFCYSNAEMTNPPGCTATPSCYLSCHISPWRILQVSRGGDVLLDKSPLLLCFSPICPLVLRHWLISFPENQPHSFDFLFLLCPFYFNVSVYRRVCPMLIRYKPNNNNNNNNKQKAKTCSGTVICHPRPPSSHDPFQLQIFPTEATSSFTDLAISCLFLLLK